MQIEKWPGVLDEVIFRARSGIGIQTVGGVMMATAGADVANIPATFGWSGTVFSNILSARLKSA